jgi:hypothetical protein
MIIVRALINTITTVIIIFLVCLKNNLKDHLGTKNITAQPEEIRNHIDAHLQAVEVKTNPQIGTQLIKFCSKYELVKMNENVKPLADILSKSLPKEIANV